MKSALALLAASVTCLVPTLSPLAHDLPPDVVAAGKLMAFSYTADAVESQCPGEAAAAMVSWRDRNRQFFGILDAYGKRVKWFPDMTPNPAKWQALQKERRQAAAIRVADALAIDKAEGCRRLVDEYRSGKLDLRNYPEDLQALEAYGR